MDVSARAGFQSAAWVAVVLGCCAAVGIASGVEPKIGLEAVLGIAFVVAVVANVAFGLCLFTVLSFLEVYNIGGAALSLMKVAGLLLLVSWLAGTEVKRRDEARSLIVEHPVLTAAVVAFVSWSAISAVWAVSSGTALSSTERYLLNILLFPIVFGTILRRDQFKWVITAFVVGAVASALYGLSHSVDGRLGGGLGDPNTEASVLVAGLALTIGLAGTMPKGSRGRVWTVIAGVVIAAGLLNTASRGGLVALGSVLVAAAFLGGRWRAKAAVVALVALAGFGLYTAVLVPLSERQHLSSTSSTGRTDLWKVGLKMFEANPVGGVGSGNFEHASVDYVQRAGPLTTAGLIIDVPHVTHNMYLEVLDELGVPGLIALLAVLTASLAAGIRAARLYERAGDVSFELMSRMLVLAIIGVLVAAFFISDEYSKQLWLLLALTFPLLALAQSRAAQ